MTQPQPTHSERAPKPYYDDGAVTIYHGDCREILPTLGHAAASVVVSDPPYGMGHRSGKRGAFGDCTIQGDEDTAARDWVVEWWQPRPALLFGRWSVPKPTGTKMVLTWDKGELLGMGDLSLPWGPTTEEIYVLGKGFIGKRSPSVLRFQAIGPYQQARGERLHPTQKPIELMRALILKCPEGVVLEPFMGSGSTLRAAKDVGRRAIGVERDERYCEIAARRMGQEVLDLAA